MAEEKDATRKSILVYEDQLRTVKKARVELADEDGNLPTLGETVEQACDNILNEGEA